MAQGEEAADALLGCGLQESEGSRAGAKPVGSQNCSLHSAGAPCAGGHQKEPKGLQAEPRPPWTLLMKSLGSISFSLSILKQFPSLGSVGVCFECRVFPGMLCGTDVGLVRAWLVRKSGTMAAGQMCDQRFSHSQTTFIGFQMNCPSGQKKEVHLEKPMIS